MTKAFRGDTAGPHQSERRRKTGIVARRSMPIFFIVDRFMKSLHRTEGLKANFDSAPSLTRLQPAFKNAWENCVTIIEPFDDDTVFRIVPLPGILDGCFQVFVDSFDRSSSYKTAAKRFGLTRREAEIIPLILRGLTNAQISATLYIADSTVAGHVTSIMRKTWTTKRSQIIARLYQLEDGRQRLKSDAL